MRIKIFVEGGGNNNPSLKKECRENFRIFFIKAGLEGNLPSVIACGSRTRAYDKFCTALKSSDDSLLLLLVDSEEPITSETAWKHVKKRTGDRWEKPSSAKDDQIFLMVQIMESWFLADVAALKEYFGNGFNESKIPNRDDIETISKSSVYQRLKDATENCREPYSKGKSSFKLLGRIDPKLVMKKSTHAQDLFNALTSREK